ncbi:MAG: simple sugar transport system permease protein [Chloroflexi bacterium]|nr:MAG: simple sugar transport system permease protein [Chloroflexota bacterium]
MSTASETIVIPMSKGIRNRERRRRITMGVFFLLAAAFTWLVFAVNLTPNAMTRFVMTPGGSSTVAPDWIFPTGVYLNIIAGICAMLGTFQIVRGFGKRTYSVLALVAILFIFGFLSWATSGGQTNLGGLLRVMVVRAVPLTLGALSGILCERAGVVNIAIEGMMLTGAFVSTVFASLSHSLVIGLLAGVVAGGFMGVIHGVLSIKYKINQIISGTVINIFSIGITSYLSSKYIQRSEFQYLNEPGMFPQIEVPVLSKIPFIGPILFHHNIYVFAMVFFVLFITFLLYKTRWGLRLRSVGEHPKAADTLGINVFRTRYMAVILGGMMAGFGGTYFSLGSSGRFDEVMTAGRGFIGLAAMIFGNWNPIGSMGAGFLFGFFDSLSVKASLLQVPLPSEFLGMVPYLATIVVLAGVVGRGQMPAADGVPYEKE